jgi:hypothetical protein
VKRKRKPEKNFKTHTSKFKKLNRVNWWYRWYKSTMTRVTADEIGGMSILKGGISGISQQ